MIGSRRFRVAMLVLILLCGLVVQGSFPALAVGPAAPQTFTVTSVSNSGAGTLRQAILDANARPGLDYIFFNLPGSFHMIALSTPLPTITSPVIIDGYTQPGASKATDSTPATVIIEVFGAAISLDANGLVINAGNSTVRGLSIQHFGGAAIILQNGDVNTIEGNYLGIDATGDYLAPNGVSILIQNGSFYNRIGTNGDGIEDVAERNLFGRDTEANIKIVGDGAFGNVIAGNTFNLKVTSNEKFDTSGVAVLVDGAPQTRIGTNGDGVADLAERNVIVGSVQLINNASMNLIAGNYIGTDASGATRLADSPTLITIQNGNQNRIGTNGDGVGDLAERNVIAGGVSITGDGGDTTGNNIVAGNYIGLKANGTTKFGTIAADGVSITSSYENRIGTNGDSIGDTDERNVIAGMQSGIKLDTALHSLIAGNYIGTDANGAGILGNSADGVTVVNSDSTTIGGTTAGLGNLIAGSTGYGIQAGPTTFILGNRITSNADKGITIAPPFNLPTLSSGLSHTAGIAIGGSLNSTPDTTYRVEFFSSLSCDPSGEGEGKDYLGNVDVPLDGSGSANFATYLGVPVRPGRVITATATGPDGSSAFSVCRTVTRQPDTVGVFRPSNSTFYLRNSNTTGVADIVSVFGQSSDLPVAGDWNEDGIDTIGVYRQSSGTFLLKNSNAAGAPVALTFVFGGPGDLPLAGDWDGDGQDSIGVYRPSNGRFLLRNALSGGAADFQMTLGTSADKPVAGDWNGDGIDSPGLFRPTNARFFLTDQVINGAPTVNYQLTLGNANDVGFAGDWDGDGVGSVGVFRPSNGRLFLRNALTTGFADVQIIFGIANDKPVAGRWIGLPGQPASAPPFAPEFEAGQ